MRFFSSKFFHTQGGFSVLILLAFGYEKYYICTEIWEELRLPPFFVTFPLKTGILGAHLGKSRCASRKNWVRIQEKLGAHPEKTTRRVGKIGRRKVFSKVKDVNVESRKKRSKLLVFRRNSSTFLSSSLCLLSRHLLSRWVRFDLITKLSTQFLKKHPHFFHKTSKYFFKGRKKDVICFFLKKTLYICIRTIVIMF